MTTDSTAMPDGSVFAVWADRTACTRVYHVAGADPRASDDNPGTEERPLRTISRAAGLLQPGEKAVIHGGTYREWVRPARGGEGPDRMIAYEAAPGEAVVVKGSRVVRGPFAPSTGWGRGQSRAWMCDMPAEWFGEFNPFLAGNIRGHFLTMDAAWLKAREHVLLGRQGLVFADGQPLRQVVGADRLEEADGTFWVERHGRRLHLRLPGDADPAGATIEATVQEQVFAPVARELGYIRVSGLTLEHAGDAIIPPQDALLSANRGHHWIVEDCTVRHAHAVGVDIGRGTWGAAPAAVNGGHIFRRNHVSRCGQCGIAGFELVDDTLVEDNLFEHIGDLDIEWYLESGALKFHVCNRVLIRGNVFRHIRHAPGVWLDYLCSHNRVTDNVFADIETMLGATYIEGPQKPNRVDHNLYWDIRNGDHRDPQPPWVEHGGLAVDCDCGEGLRVDHNLFARAAGRFAVALHLQQHTRMFGGRSGLCRDHAVEDNVFADCRRMIHFGRMENNRADGNVYPRAMPRPAFTVRYPEPAAQHRLDSWKEQAGQDGNSLQAAVTATFDPAARVLNVTVADADGSLAGKGLLTAEEWTAAAADGTQVTLPRRRRGPAFSA